ncbi:MAG: AraC family ligand binding domain-containing protein, partial [Christensenellales bacterium]
MITIHDQSDFTISYVSSGMFLGSDWSHPERTIDSYELLFVTKGEVYLHYNGERHVLCEGDAIIIYPGILHGGYKISQGDTSFYWFHFLLSDPAFISGLPEVLRIEDDLKMKTLLNQMLDVTNAGTY